MKYIVLVLGVSGVASVIIGGNINDWPLYAMCALTTVIGGLTGILFGRY